MVIMYAGTPIQQSELPSAARTFITKHFAQDNVRKVEKDKGHRGMEYEVDFVSGAEVNFNSEGEWKEVKAAQSNSVLSAIVPDAILKYISENFKGLSIIEISRKLGGYGVKLSNGTELKLTKDAKRMPARNGKRFPSTK